MLSHPEKAYWQALMAVRRKDYLSAARFFEQAAPGMRKNREFDLLRETNRLLLAVKRELDSPNVESSIDIEEKFSHG